MKDVEHCESLAELGIYLELMTMLDAPLYNYHDMMHVWNAVLTAETRAAPMEKGSTIRQLTHVKMMLLFLMRKGVPQGMLRATLKCEGSMTM